MLYFGCLIAIALIGSFFTGCLIGSFFTKSRRYRIIRHKPESIAHLIRVLEDIIYNWDGSDEELEALIALENTVLYNSWERKDVKL